MKANFALSAISGFVIGGIIGFAYTREVKRTAPQYVKTGMQNGVVYAHYNAKSNLLNSLPF